VSRNVNNSLDALTSGNMQMFLQRLAWKELWEYLPLEEQLQCITDFIHAHLAEINRKCHVKVIPHSSFVTKTPLKGHADLDIDLIIPEDFMIWDGQKIGEYLEKDAFGKKIIFTVQCLKSVLEMMWKRLSDENKGNPNSKLLLASKWFKLSKDMSLFTHSIAAWTREAIPGIAEGQRVATEAVPQRRTHVNAAREAAMRTQSVDHAASDSH
jgi:hypothetical protein